jgi:hypothetical protein
MMADQIPALIAKFTKTSQNMRDLMDLVKREVFLEFNSHHICNVENVNYELQTASVTINYPKTVYVSDVPGVFYPIQQPYPILTDVPFHVISDGSEASLTMPIKPGAQGLVCFNDRDIGNWFATGQNQPVASTMLHSLSDGLLFVGFRSLKNPIANYDPIRAVLSNGEARIGVKNQADDLLNGSGKVLIANDTFGTLGPNFKAFFMALSTFVTACEASITDPVLAAAATAFAATFTVPVAPSTQGYPINIPGVLE